MRIDINSSEIHGKGVFALEDIATGEVVHIIDDSRLVDEENPLNPDRGELEEHCDYLPDGTVVLMQAPERYINHSCDPNVHTYSCAHKRYLLAMADIAKGSEITYDYSINAIDGDVWVCSCGSPTCRGEHKCDFFCLPVARQLQYLPYLDPWFAESNQSKIATLLQTAAQQGGELDAAARRQLP